MTVYGVICCFIMKCVVNKCTTMLYDVIKDILQTYILYYDVMSFFMVNNSHSTIKTICNYVCRIQKAYIHENKYFQLGCYVNFYCYVVLLLLLKFDYLQREYPVIAQYFLYFPIYTETVQRQATVSHAAPQNTVVYWATPKKRRGSQKYQSYFSPPP